MENVSIAAEKAEEKLLKVAAEVDKFKGFNNGHAARIAVLSDRLAIKFNLAAHDRLALRQAALIHDIGELVMNRDYIKSTDLLTEAERIDVERHPVIGEQEAAKRSFSRAVQLLVRWHHEWWNGTGYPDAISRQDIPLGARILRAADTFSALTADRLYRAQISGEDAKQYLIENAGIEFDPKVVREFLLLDDL